MLNIISYPSAAALLKFVNRCLKMIPQRNSMLVKFYFLANLRKKEAAWQINFTVFTLAPFLFSQGLCFLGDWALHSSLSLLQTAHGQNKMSVGCMPEALKKNDNKKKKRNTLCTDVAPFRAQSFKITPVAGTTCFGWPAHSCSLQSVEVRVVVVVIWSMIYIIDHNILKHVPCSSVRFDSGAFVSSSLGAPWAAPVVW